jgi:hypothetical protein
LYFITGHWAGRGHRALRWPVSDPGGRGARFRLIVDLAGDDADLATELQEIRMDTRLIAVLALVIAVIVLLILVL